jgi:hypothetical protein
LNEKGLAMRLAGEVPTNVVDVTGLSLAELSTIDDLAFAMSLEALTSRKQCSQTGVLQNQVREDI